MIVDREHDNHREINLVSHCEVVQSFVFLDSLIDSSGYKSNNVYAGRPPTTFVYTLQRDKEMTAAENLRPNPKSY
ncbi:unnamed protein product [Callosobruchus maculatus]|uniref:Uncharacterized protein n=1 Tax=Callosobruchus maculatus TaxID=64391 RepID=A0A653BY31_CALMS|nr:unnamed protein product [Callosobruchus maculatus]